MTKWDFIKLNQIHPVSEDQTRELQKIKDQFYGWLKEKGELKLNIGCGGDIRDGWLNIDAIDNNGVDVIADVTDLSMFPDECSVVVENNHIIEHISYRDTLVVLKEWIRLLKIGGEFILRCPDVGKMCQRYSEGSWVIGPDGTERNIINVLYGNFEDPIYGVHRAGFDKALINRYLRECGLIDIKVTDSDRGHEFELFARGFRSALS